ncbi:MAG: hypothetical protein HFE63_05025 [Clostridiales bacterium]|nr:hypothetical protein [Clostridiales bacterium]
MFGYIKPISAELKVKEYELYRSVYCGLCAALGRNTSCISRLTLSYDFVFLALIRMSLAGETGHIEKKRCIAHPTKKRAVLVDALQLDYCARVSSLLTYHKLRDDITDNKGLKRIGTYMLLPAAGGMLRRAKKGGDIDELEAVIVKKLDELASIEKENILSPDRAAEPFGELMAAVCSYGFDKGSREVRIAGELGRHIGRFIYIADAVDDLSDDLKSGNYNPFRSSSTENTLTDFNPEFVRSSLTMELIGVERAVELMDFGKVPEYGNIIRNVIYLGLPALIESILKDKNPQE